MKNIGLIGGILLALAIAHTPALAQNPDVKPSVTLSLSMTPTFMRSEGDASLAPALLLNYPLNDNFTFLFGASYSKETISYASCSRHIAYEDGYTRTSLTFGVKYYFTLGCP